MKKRKRRGSERGKKVRGGREKRDRRWKRREEKVMV